MTWVDTVASTVKCWHQLLVVTTVWEIRCSVGRILNRVSLDTTILTMLSALHDGHLGTSLGPLTGCHLWSVNRPLGPASGIRAFHGSPPHRLFQGNILLQYSYAACKTQRLLWGSKMILKRYIIEFELPVICWSSGRIRRRGDISIYASCRWESKSSTYIWVGRVWYYAFLFHNHAK